MVNAIKQDSIAEQVADFLRKEIVNGTLKAGEKVIEYDICNQLNVSRTPVREAFRILQAEGYLSHRPRFGAYVTELSVQDVLDCWEVRTHLEEMVARKTAQNCNEKTKALIRRELEKIDAALKDEALSEEKYRSLDETYYNIHVSNCNNKKLEEVARGLRVSSGLMCGKPKYAVARAKEALREITNIYNAYIENNPEKAVKCNRIHFEASLRDITQFL